MKNLHQHNALNGFRLLLMLVILAIQLPAVAQQDTISPSAGRMELGLRSDHVDVFNYSLETYQDETTEQRSSNWGVELYGLRLGNRHNFIRFSLGIAGGASELTRTSTLPGTRIDRHTVSSNKSITSSFSYGYVWKPFRGKVSSRFQFRGGITVAHRIKLVDSNETYEIDFESTTAFTVEQESSNESRGLQEIQLRAFGQFHFRIWKGLCAGLEWQWGPKVEFGFVRQVHSSRTLQNGQVVNENATIRDDARAKLIYQQLPMTTLIALGWMF